MPAEPTAARVEAGQDRHAVAQAPFYDAETPEISVIILNYNKPELTRTCLRHLWAHTAGHRHEIIVVDNGSSPENFAPLRELEGPGRVIRLEVNRYFGEGNNIGAEAARGDYVLFLNNDAFVTPGWLEPLVERLRNEPLLGGVGPCFLYPDGRVQEAGGFVRPDGVIVQIGKTGAYAKHDVEEDHVVDYCSAACFLMRRDLFLEIGGFEYVYEPAYYEDVDLCLKIAVRGLFVGYCSRSRVVHVESATSSSHRQSLGLDNILEVNRRQFLRRWGKHLAQRDAAALQASPAIACPPGFRSGKPRAVFRTPYAITPGGGERYLLTAALALQQDFDVHLLLDEVHSETRMRAIGRDLDLDLSGLRLSRMREVGDLGPIAFAVSMSNESIPPHPPFAPRSLYICQFPFPYPAEEELRRSGNLHGFDGTIVYSEFVRTHLRRVRSRNGLDDHPSDILAPPVPRPPQGTVPAPLAAPYRFVAIGRFFTGGHNKRHDVAIELIRRLVARGIPVELDLVGSLPPFPEHRSHFQWLRGLATGLPIRFHANATQEELRAILARGHFYIHAAGYEVDADLHPHACEHFGISVLEAMAYGLVPFVVANGGPATLVGDGTRGYHYRSMEELEARALQALDTPAQLAQLRGAAAAAADEFGEDVFIEGWRRLAAKVSAARP